MDGFDERSLTDAERSVQERILAGEIADFRGGESKPRLRSDLLTHLALKAPPRGLRVRGAHITGPLDLSCVTLPSVLLEDCEIPSRIDVSNAHLGALSLDRSRLQHVLARGASIDGPFDFSDVAPYADEAWVDASKALIRGGIMAERAKLKTPAKRPKEQVQHWDHVYAVRLSEAQIMGGVWLVDHFVADGGVCLDETYIRGTFSMAKGSLVTASEGDVYHPGDAFHAYALRCDGMFALNFGFAARGRIFIINSKFGSRVNIDGDLRGTRPGYDFKGRVMNTNASLMLEHCEIGTSVGLYDATIDCGVSLAHSTIGNGVSLARTRITNKSPDGKGVALSFEQTVVGEDILFGSGFSAEGVVTLARSRVGGDVDLAGASLINESGVALDVRRARIAGEIRPRGLSTGQRDGVAAVGQMDFTGAKVG